MNYSDLDREFAEYEKELPCPNCKQAAKPSVAGNNWKCHSCNHLFKKDGSKPSMDCFCKICTPCHDPLAGKTQGKKAELQLPDEFEKKKPRLRKSKKRKDTRLRKQS